MKRYLQDCSGVEVTHQHNRSVEGAYKCGSLYGRHVWILVRGMPHVAATLYEHEAH
jgi:hypothetical protein